MVLKPLPWGLRGPGKVRSCCEVVQKLMYGKVLHPPEQENCKQVLDQGSCTGFTQDIKNAFRRFLGVCTSCLCWPNDQKLYQIMQLFIWGELTGLLQREVMSQKPLKGSKSTGKGELSPISTGFYRGTKAVTKIKVLPLEIKAGKQRGHFSREEGCWCHVSWAG